MENKTLTSALSPGVLTPAGTQQFGSVTNHPGARPTSQVGGHGPQQHCYSFRQ